MTEQTAAANFANTPKPPYYAAIFSAQHAAELSGYAEMGEKMLQLATQQPGFLGIENANNPDGFSITVSYWESADAIVSWKANADHAAAQALGKKLWYEHYELRICKVEHAYGFTRNASGQ